MLEGEIDAARGKMLEAIQAYHQALAQQDVGEIAVKIYGAEVRGGDKHGAFTRLNQWLDAHPEDPVARATIGDVSLANGDYRGAATHSERVMKIPQVPSLVRNSVEWAYFELKAPQALAAAEAAYKATAVSGLIADTLGWILAEQGDVARGGTTAQALTLEPDNLVIGYHLVAALARAGDRDAAQDQLKKILASGKTFAGAKEAQALLASLK